MSINEKSSEHQSQKLSASNKVRSQSQPSIEKKKAFGTSMIEKKKQELERVKQRQAKELRVMLENEVNIATFLIPNLSTHSFTNH